jgi:hypothetical protein
MPNHVSPTKNTYKALSLQERLTVALAPEVPDVYRQCLLAEQWIQTRCYFARRLDLRPEEIELLVHDEDHIIRLCIAKRHDLSPAQIAHCVTDSDPNVRYAISRSPQLSEEQRQQLQRDPDPLVCKAASKPAKEFATRQRPGQAVLVR